MKFSFLLLTNAPFLFSKINNKTRQNKTAMDFFISKLIYSFILKLNVRGTNRTEYRKSRILL